MLLIIIETVVPTEYLGISFLNLWKYVYDHEGQYLSVDLYSWSTPLAKFALQPRELDGLRFFIACRPTS